VNCDDHYCLPPLERFDLAEIKMLLAQKKYFVMHAPRQTGKTTFMLALVDCLKDDDLSENGLKILGEYGEHAALKVALTRFCQAGDLAGVVGTRRNRCSGEGHLSGSGQEIITGWNGSSTRKPAPSFCSRRFSSGSSIPEAGSNENTAWEGSACICSLISAGVSLLNLASRASSTISLAFKS
jgi:hypothetical protein